MEKLIFTIDSDAFFISCEELRNPELKKIPAVVGNELNGRGIVVTGNYKARKYGIHAGMPLFKARELIPDLSVIPSDFEFYIEMSNKIFDIINKYTKIMEVGSIDECFIDVTDSINKYKPIELATKIKNDVKRNTKLTVSIGISTNLILSKMASSMDKPDGITTLWKHEIKNKLWPLPINNLFMVGKSTSKLFLENKIKTIGDLANLDTNKNIYSELKNNIGINLDKYISEANGELIRNIEIGSHTLKSISKEKTMPVSITNEYILLFEARKLFEIVFKRMKLRNLSANTIHVSLKKDKTFNKFSKSKKIGTQLNGWDDIWSIIENLLLKIYDGKSSIKQISISASGLKKIERLSKQLTINQYSIKNNKLQNLIDDISEITNSEIFLGTTMINNKRYEKNKLIDNDRVKLKVWDE